MSHSLRICAPSRLHFGMLRFASREGPSFGGLGMMIDRPGVVVEISKADRWSVDGAEGERALQLMKQAVSGLDINDPQPLHLEVQQLPPPHTGLGTGTQLALAIAKGVDHLLGTSAAGIEALAMAVNRGRRGAVGSHGFDGGGLIWELGKLPGQRLGELKQRVSIPDPWRVVLVKIAVDEGLSGDKEQEAFEKLPPVPEAVTEELIGVAEGQILPAANRGDFETFSAGTYEYGIQAGNCFAPVQGGPFVSPEVAELVALIRKLGVQGVGQSSWGPTVFAFSPDILQAEQLVAQLRDLAELADAEILIAKPDNLGAKVEPIAQSSEQPIAH